MNTNAVRTSTFKSAVLLCGGLTLAGCIVMSEYEADRSAGLNGSFETARSGLPVNWLVYTPKTVPDGDFDVALDSEAYDGDQSLRFVVRECSSVGGRLSPGIATEIPAAAGEVQLISFWVLNDGARFAASVSGVSAKTGAPREIIVDTRHSPGEWTRYEYAYVMSDHDRLRFELNILGPGEIRIDAISIEAGGEKTL